jgi:predicted ribosomally synthesized peptide with SipW-like signal peptide
MKNTTFRRRALISSIAMLLVALVALGSATFAWFTSSTTATANGIKVSTIKSSELQISKSDLQWGTQVDYNTQDIFAPVSSANGSSWFTANAETKASYAKKSTDAFEAVNSAAGYYFTEALNIRNNGAADVENVKITITGLNCDYARLAIYKVTTNNGTTVASGDPTFAQSIYDNAGTQYAAASAATASGTTNITPIAIGTTNEINVGTLTGKNGDTVTGIAYYKIFVWFEGQDQQCYDANAGASFSTLTNGLTFTVSGTTSTT